MTTGHVLIVDDDVQLAEMLRMILMHRGYQTTVALSGRQVLEIVKQTAPGDTPPVDLILLDIRMPEVGGIDVCRHVRAQPGWRMVPIVMLTALHALQDRLAAFEAGANDYVTKPFQQTELLARVEAFVSLRIAQLRQQEAEQQVRQLAARLVEAQEEERQRLARELHDEVGQMLTGVKLNLAMLKDSLPEDAAEAQELIAETRSLVDTTMTGVRRLATAIRPAALDDLGLIPALRSHIAHFAERTGLEVTANLDAGGQRLLRPIETALYRIIQEATTNIIRHAGAQRVQLVLRIEDGTVYGCVADDGQGFDPETRLPEAWREGHIGLLGIQERVASLHGRLEIRSAPGQGTKLEIWLPLGREEEPA